MPHTPGPWMIEGVNSERLHDICLAYDVPKEGRPILVGSVYYDDPQDTIHVFIDEKEATANARVMSKSPELLAMLKLCVNGGCVWKRGSDLVAAEKLISEAEKGGT